MISEQRLRLRIVNAFLIANAVAALGLLLRISCDPHILRNADDACFTFGDYSYAAIVWGTAALFIASSLITMIPVAAIVMLARRYNWTSAFPYLIAGAAIGPILLTIRFSAGGHSIAAGHILQEWASEVAWSGIIGGVSAFIFWLVSHKRFPSFQTPRKALRPTAGSAVRD
jgi:hypothetical protein